MGQLGEILEVVLQYVLVVVGVYEEIAPHVGEKPVLGCGSCLVDELLHTSEWIPPKTVGCSKEPISSRRGWNWSSLHRDDSAGHKFRSLTQAPFTLYVKVPCSSFRHFMKRGRRHCKNSALYFTTRILFFLVYLVNIVVSLFGESTRCFSCKVRLKAAISGPQSTRPRLRRGPAASGPIALLREQSPEVMLPDQYYYYSYPLGITSLC